MQQPHLAPSRKDTILILLIVGWMVCGLASFGSYWMAKQDIEQIDAGMMDGRDREQLNMMKIVSMVHIGLMLFGVLALCCYFGAVAVFVGGGAASGGY